MESNDAKELEEALSEANTRAEDFRQRYLYAVADLDNAKKRMQRSVGEAERRFKKRLLRELLPVLDNLERALSHQDSEGLREGLAATLRGFEAVLQDEGVTPILTIGEPFDPQVAEAISTEPKPSVPNNLVIAETQRGYRLDGDLLRPAQVIVAKND